MLVVLGHFFQSMTQMNVLSANELYQWFNQTIYYFHVPLFFICSVYLYQKLSVVNDIYSWGRDVLKTLFSSLVNSQIGELGDTLFFYTTFRTRTMAVIGCIIASAFKAPGIFGGGWSASYFIHPFKRNLVRYWNVSECI